MSDIPEPLLRQAIRLNRILEVCKVVDMKGKICYPKRVR